MLKKEYKLIKPENFPNLRYLSSETSIEDINDMFNGFLRNLRFFLGINPINVKAEILFPDDSSEDQIDIREEPFSIGAKTKINTESSSVTIEITPKGRGILPIILIREAYRCFVPDPLTEYHGINIILYHLSTIELEGLQLHSEYEQIATKWAHLIKDKIDEDYREAGFSSISQYFKINNYLNADKVQYFFYYIRENQDVILRASHKGFFNSLFNSYRKESGEVLRNEDAVEVIRISKDMFYTVKKYSLIAPYDKLINKFIGKSKKYELDTYLNIKEYINKMEELLVYTEFAPTFQTIYSYFDMVVYPIYLRFNPILKKRDIDQVLQYWPFMRDPHIITSSLGVEYTGFLVSPKVYETDIDKCLQKLKDDDYLIEALFFRGTLYEHIMDANFYREFYRFGRLISPNHRDYEVKYLFSHFFQQ